MKDNAYRQDIVTGIMLLYVSGVNYNVNSNYEVFRTTLRTNFYVLEYFHDKLGNLVAPPIDGTAKCLVHCKAHLVL